jgi:hypothetical protein
VAVFGDEGEPNITSRAKKAAAFLRMSRSARRRATSFFRAAISTRSARICQFPGKAAAGVAVSSRIQRRNTLSATSRSRAACASATPRSVNNLTASILNSLLNFRLVISVFQFLGHDFIFVSTKPAAAQNVGVIVGALAHGTVSPLVEGAAMDVRIMDENTIYDAEKRIGQSTVYLDLTASAAQKGEAHLSV